jgi:hypothetical protein
MKTPRDILLERHQSAAPKLDAIRREVVIGLNHQDTKAQRQAINLVSWCLGGSHKLWLELIWPCRRIWTGLAAVWVLIFIINFSQRDSSQIVMAKSAPPATMTMTFRDQQKLLNELFAERSLPMDAERPKFFSPKPRTETMRFETV